MTSPSPQSMGNTAEQAAPDTAQQVRRLQKPHTDLGRYVSRTVQLLQKRALAHGGDSWSSATLARLRRAVQHSVGADPLVWEFLFEGMPDRYFGTGDDPSRSERAVHAAATLYAVHQQSKDRPMHVDGEGFGTAIRRLANPQDAAELSMPVLRRFNALATADNLDEQLHHARGLVQLMRRESIGFDYGTFAEDLAALQNAERADGVRIRWARQFHRSIRPAFADGDGTDSDIDAAEHQPT